MSKTWVLRTATKGTGAHVVPLEKAQTARVAVEPVKVPRKPAPPVPPPVVRQRRRFRVIDIMTREVIADDVSAREVVGVLGEVRSPMDVSVFVWQEDRERWRRLTFPEERQLFELARRGPVEPSDRSAPEQSAR